MLVAHVERADALLERKQRLVDLSAFEPPILVGAVERIRAAFGAGEVDKREAADLWSELLTPTLAAVQRELQHRVRPRRVGIGRRRGGHACTRRELEKLVKVGEAGDWLEGEADDVHLLLPILAHAQLLPLPQKIEHLAAVDLVAGDTKPKRIVLGTHE